MRDVVLAARRAGAASRPGDVEFMSVEFVQELRYGHLRKQLST